MSCTNLYKEHIDVMVWAAYKFSNRYDSHSSNNVLRWWDPEWSHFSPRETFHLCGLGGEDRETMTRMGQILTDQNYRSVNERYGEDTPVPTYRYERPKSQLWTPEEVIGACHCYEYQSCETGDWATCKARWLCDQIKDQCVGYIVDRAEQCSDKRFCWSIGPDTVPAQRDKVEDRYRNIWSLKDCVRPDYVDRFVQPATDRLEDVAKARNDDAREAARRSALGGNGAGGALRHKA